MSPLVSRRALIGGALALSACGRGGSKPVALKDVTLRVATYKGQIDSFFAPAGEAAPPYTVSKALFAGGNQIVEAINAGAIDFGGMSEIPPIFAAAADPLFRLIAVQQYDVNNQVVLVPAGSTIHDAAGLRGKRVGYVRATTSHYILLRLLDEAGLTFADVVPIALSPSDGLTAFQQGRLDAWVIYGVQGSLARSTGARVLATGKGRLSGNYVVAASTAALADPLRRETIGDYLGKIARTFAWSVANPAAWATALAKDTGVPEAIWLQQFRERSSDPRIMPVTDAAIASQQQVADRFATAKVIPAKVDVRPLWSTALNARIAKIY